MQGTIQVQEGTNGSFELEELLNSPTSSTTNQNNSETDLHRLKEKDRKGRLIVNTFLKNHHHSNRNVNATNLTPTSTTTKKPMKKLDEYGFIVNIDDKGTLRNEESFYVSGGASTPNMDYTHTASSNGMSHEQHFNVNNFQSKHKNIMRRRKRLHHTTTGSNKHGGSSSDHHNSNSYPSLSKSPSDPTSISSHNTSTHHPIQPPSPSRLLNRTKRHKLKLQQKLIHRREKKWNQMIKDYKSITSSKPKLKKLHSRVRKGIPNSMRGKAWVTMAQVDSRIKAMNGVYADLVEQSCTDKLGGIHEALLPYVVDEEEEENGFGGSSSHELDVQKQYDTVENGTNGNNANDPTVDIMKETIERDINRTFPRHSMFYDSYSDSSDEEDEENEKDEYYDSNVSDHGLEKKDGNNSLYDEEMSDDSYDRVSLTGSLGSAGQYSADMANLIQDIDHLDTSRNGGNLSSHEKADTDCWSKSVEVIKQATANCPLPYGETRKENALVSMKSPPLPPSSATPSRKEKKKVDFATEEGGQAILRRVLRAYSLYDPEVGYCQGMNFIAGMFITFVSEEEAFWLLVYVMNAKPCRMRGLFGVGMSEAHQVLYVAEKLIAQFNPKLSKHFDRENVHITMFATQWLLTMYTSSFPFHIVTRVWDCFILEGWKVAYRVMLALLEMATSDLLKLRFEDILNYFKLLPFQVDVNALFDAMFTVPLKKRHIEKYAKEWLRKQKTDKIVKEQKRRRGRNGKKNS